MDFGIFNIMQQRDVNKSVSQVYDEGIEQTIIAEQLGFTRAWYAEHHFSNYSLCPSPLMMACHMAARTSTIRLGTAVVVAPLYKPARLLAEIGMVDTLSKGRLDLGIGMGYQQFEFERFGIDLANSAQMTGEVMDMIKLGLNNAVFEYEGKCFVQPRTAINAKPFQRRVPLYYAGGDPGHLRKIASANDTLMITGGVGGVTRMKAARRNYEEIAVSVGKSADDVKLAVARLGFVTKSKKDAAQFIECARYQQRLALSLKQRRAKVVDDYIVEESPFDGEPSLDEIARNLPVGDVDSCIEKMVRLARELKPVHIMIQSQVGDMSQKQTLASLELWANEVLPAVKRELQSASERVAA